MRRLLLVFGVLCCACDVNPGVRTIHQPLPMGVPTAPVLEGELPGEALGTSVAGCRFPGGFVAGSPGDNLVQVLLPDGTSARRTQALPFGRALGEEVACEGSETRWSMATSAGGGFYAFAWDAGGPLTAPGAQSLARSNTHRPHSLAIGRPGTGEVQLLFFNQDAGSFDLDPPLVMRLDVGAGSAVAWARDDELLAVSDVSNGIVRLVDPASQQLVSGGRFDGPPNKGFGRSLAFGDVHPAAGEELLVSMAGTREVIVLGKVNGQLRELQRVGPLGNASGAPLPLAVEPTSFLALGSLQAFWVGVPEEDAVFRFIGDAGTAFPSSEGIDFGAALGLTGQSLLVGAPGFDAFNAPDAGAVFLLELNTDVLPTAEPLVCKVGTSCLTSQCLPGRCVGGVVCQPSTSVRLCSEDRCFEGVCLQPDGGVDAGTPDAGSPDAGLRDGGSEDGGQGDAGLADAGRSGPVTFIACGCSSGGVASTSLLAVLLVLLWRRGGAAQR